MHWCAVTGQRSSKHVVAIIVKSGPILSIQWGRNGRWANTTPSAAPFDPGLSRACGKGLQGLAACVPPSPARAGSGDTDACDIKHAARGIGRFGRRLR